VNNATTGITGFQSTKMVLALAAFFTGGLTFASMAQDVVATLSGAATVKDGDGLLFGNIEVRLQGIAAPELGDPMGRESYLALVEIAEGKHVVCKLDGTTAGKGIRPVGVCYIDDVDVGRSQVVLGFALDCPAYSNGRYRDEELKARSVGFDLSKVYKRPGYC
jgi:micrococcal nuclease